MRVDLSRYRSAYRSIRFRSVALIIVGILTMMFGGFWIVMMIMVLLVGKQEIWDLMYAPTVGIGLGVFPSLIGLALVIWGITGFAKLGRLRELVTVARHTPNFATDDVARGLGVDRRRADKAILEGVALGILVDQPAQFAEAPAPGLPFATTVYAPSGRVLKNTYRLEQKLGSGGGGEVFAAVHLRTGRRYAVKLLIPNARMSADSIRRFEREATAASAVGHPGIIAVHDFDQSEDGQYYLVMDLLEGETLEQRLSRVGCLAWPEARKIALELCSALAAAHEHGLLHRDLKPANVFLSRAPDASERAILLDFGLVKPLEEAARSRITVTGAALGTPMYMSPEQARGEKLDVRSDVYSLGAVIYEMVTGAPPFLDQTLAAVYARLLTESAARASSLATQPLPAEVDDVLDRALAKTPGERFENARALSAALERMARPLRTLASA